MILKNERGTAVAESEERSDVARLPVSQISEALGSGATVDLTRKCTFQHGVQRIILRSNIMS